MSIGFSPDEWNALKDHLLSIGRLSEGLKYGVLKESDKGTIYDFYKNRIVFPIRDERKRIVSFGGRILGDDKPKYLNGPVTDIYSKDTVLYGAPDWKGAIVKARTAITTEGYFDVVMAVEKGVDYAVASCGTALSGYYIKQIKKYLKDGRLILGMDGDEAGNNSMSKVIVECLKEGIMPEVLSLEEGEDLDDFFKRNGHIEGA